MRSCPAAVQPARVVPDPHPQQPSVGHFPDSSATRKNGVTCAFGRGGRRARGCAERVIRPSHRERRERSAVGLVDVAIAEEPKFREAAARGGAHAAERDGDIPLVEPAEQRVEGLGSRRIDVGHGLHVDHDMAHRAVPDGALVSAPLETDFERRAVGSINEPIAESDPAPRSK